uniref:Uncharacterized protein n=1 Tax=Neospora caninum (strain Liverpool) TaxID=572307 RepID=A0A0F7URV0_NEOCL|nr:TPA: hypothetical protein BN1204_064995 [Neospora caninum Liverpool]
MPAARLLGESSPSVAMHPVRMETSFFSNRSMRKYFLNEPPNANAVRLCHCSPPEISPLISSAFSPSSCGSSFTFRSSSIPRAPSASPSPPISRSSPSASRSSTHAFSSRFALRVLPSLRGCVSSLSCSLFCRGRTSLACFLLFLCCLSLHGVPARADTHRSRSANLSRPSFSSLPLSSSFVLGSLEASAGAGVYTPWHVPVREQCRPQFGGFAPHSRVSPPPSFSLPSSYLSSFSQPSSLSSPVLFLVSPCASLLPLSFFSSSLASFASASAFSALSSCARRPFAEQYAPSAAASPRLFRSGGGAACSFENENSRGRGTNLRAFTIFVNPDTAPENKDMIVNTYNRMCITEGHIRRIRENQRRVKRVTRGEGGSYLVLRRRKELYWAKRKARETEKKVDWTAIGQLRHSQLKRLIEALDSNVALEERKRRAEREGRDRRPEERMRLDR